MSMTLTSILMTSALGLSQEASEPLVENCYLMLADEGAELIEMEVQVQELTADDDLSEITIPEGTQLSNIMCSRTELKLAENDYKLAIAGVPLMVAYDNENGERSAIMFRVLDGQFAVEVVQGELTDEQRNGLVTALEGYYAALEPAEDEG